MRNRVEVRKVDIITLTGAVLIIGAYSCKKQDSEKEDASPTVSVDKLVKEPSKGKSLLKDPVSLEERLYNQTKIAFCSKRDGNWEIYVTYADGSEQKNLTNNPGEDATPHWSPDGTKIAFVSSRDGNPEIYIMNADGSEQKRVTHNPNFDFIHSWSPDGKIIVFHLAKDENCDIYVINADGYEQKRLTNTARDGAASWSPFLPSEIENGIKK